MEAVLGNNEEGKEKMKTWRNYHLEYKIYIKEIPETDRHYRQYLKHKNRKIVTTEVSGMKNTKPIRFTYTFDNVKEIIRLLCEATEGGKPEVEKELGIKIDEDEPDIKTNLRTGKIEGR